MFNSHKYDELEDLKDILGVFDKYFDVKVYINSKDLLLPTNYIKRNSFKNKKRIKVCNKFILLAANENGTIE